MKFNRLAYMLLLAVGSVLIAAGSATHSFPPSFIPSDSARSVAAYLIFGGLLLVILALVPSNEKARKAQALSPGKECNAAVQRRQGMGAANRNLKIFRWAVANSVGGILFVSFGIYGLSEVHSSSFFDIETLLFFVMYSLGVILILLARDQGKEALPALTEMKNTVEQSEVAKEPKEDYTYKLDMEELNFKGLIKEYVRVNPDVLPPKDEGTELEIEHISPREWKVTASINGERRSALINIEDVLGLMWKYIQVTHASQIRMLTM